MAGGTSSAAKDKRRREAKEKTRLANAKVEEYRKAAEESKRKLEEISKNGETPELKDEYERLKSEVDGSGDTLMEYEAEANRLIKEEKQIEEMDVDPEKDDGSLFVPGNPDGSKSGSGQPGGFFGSKDPPLVDLTDEKGSKGKPAVDGDPDDAGLFTPDQAREAMGIDADGKVVVWRQQGYSKPVIVAYGPPNARKYERSTAYQSGIEFDGDETPQFGPDHRVGDEKNGKKFVRRWNEFKGIQGEAYEGDVDELRPKEKGEKRPFPKTELLVKWEIGGQIKRTWEVRSSIKHLWANPSKCDEYIYHAALHHAKQYQDWLSGQRAATSKSPSPGPSANLMPKGSQDKGKGIKKEGDDGNSGTASKSPMIQYREEWCELEEIDPATMTPEDKANFLLSWNMIKLKI